MAWLSVRADADGFAVFGGLPARGKTGAPALPVQTVPVLLPPGARPETVEVVLKDAVVNVVAGKWWVRPARPPANRDGLVWPRDRVIVNGRDVGIYRAHESYPPSHVRVTAGQMRQWKIATVSVSPYRYNPVSGELRQLAGGTIEIRFDCDEEEDGVWKHPATRPGWSAAKRRRRRLERTVVNWDDAASAYGDLDAPPANRTVRVPESQAADGAELARGDGANDQGIVFVLPADGSQPLAFGSSSEAATFIEANPGSRLDPLMLPFMSVEDVNTALRSAASEEAVQVQPADAGGGGGGQRAMSGGPETADYVIITRSAFTNASQALDDFVAAKAAAGFLPLVVTEAAQADDTHYEEASRGDLLADNIREWLSDHYEDLGIDYVLLIGDYWPFHWDIYTNMPPQWGDYWVPMRVTHANCPRPPHGGVGSDFYFAELTGNWDLNANGIFGELKGDYGAGGCDVYCEVVVGRIPYCGSVADVDHILWKTLDYEQATVPEAWWRWHALVPCDPTDEETPGWFMGEALVTNILEPTGFWSTHRIYDETTGFSPPPESSPCTYDNVLAAWTNDLPGAVFWWTHGNWEAAGDVMTISNTLQLDDNYPVFAYQGSCDNAWPPNGNYGSGSNNLAMALLENGAVCTFASTHYLYYQGGWQHITDDPSHPYANTAQGMAYGCVRRLVQGAPAGRSLQNYKQSLPFDPEIDEYFYWHNFLVMNLFGDPSLSIYSCRHGIKEIECDRTAGTVALTWDSVPNAAYTLESCTNLVQGVWSSVTNVVSTGQVTHVVLGEPTAWVKMYRLLWTIGY